MSMICQFKKKPESLLRMDQFSFVNHDFKRHPLAKKKKRFTSFEDKVYAQRVNIQTNKTSIFFST